MFQFFNSSSLLETDTRLIFSFFSFFCFGSFGGVSGSSGGFSCSLIGIMTGSSINGSTSPFLN
jgi:hypothetical protein